VMYASKRKSRQGINPAAFLCEFVCFNSFQAKRA
jgi:hypothetical protein